MRRRTGRDRAGSASPPRPTTTVPPRGVRQYRPGTRSRARTRPGLRPGRPAASSPPRAPGTWPSPPAPPRGRSFARATRSLRGFASGGGIEAVDARTGAEPRRRSAAASGAHVVEHAALEVEIRAGVEAAIARWAHGVVQRHLAVRTALQVGQPVAIEQQFAVDVVRVLEDRIDRALDGATEVRE